MIVIVDFDECEPEPCEYGRCVDGVDSYTCRCDNGFTGEQCEQSKLCHHQHK